MTTQTLTRENLDGLDFEVLCVRCSEKTGNGFYKLKNERFHPVDCPYRGRTYWLCEDCGEHSGRCRHCKTFDQYSQV